MQFFYISSKNLIENKIIFNTKFYLNNEIITIFSNKGINLIFSNN